MSTVRIWKFHAALEPDASRVAHDVLRKGSRYYNKLVEIERDRYARFAEIRRRLAPALAALEDAYETADEKVLALVREAKLTRQRHWRATKGERTLAIAPELEARLEAAKAERRRISEEAKPLRKEFNQRLVPARKLFKERAVERAKQLSPNPDTDRLPGPRTREKANAQVLDEMLGDLSIDEAWREVTASDHLAHRASIEARSMCELPPGTYLQVEEAFARAKKDSSPRAPRFRSHRGEGKVAVQLHKKTFADLLSGTTMLQLEPNPLPGRKGRSEEHFLARIRVGSKGRDPIWLTARVRLHRRPPDDAVVKWAWLIAKKEGERTRWELQLVLDSPEFTKPRRPAGVGEGSHIRLGWRTVSGGVRVALWEDDELVVPESMVARAERAELLVSHADRHWDAIVAFLRRWQRLGGNALRWDWLSRGERKRLFVRRLCVEYARFILGSATLAALWRRWRDTRPPDLFMSLSYAQRWVRAQGSGHPHAGLAWWLFTWTKKDQHLRQWAADARKGFENARDALFRETAIRLSTQHETWTIDSYSVAAVKERPKPLTRRGEAPNETAQRHVQLVAPGRFREILLSVMGSRCTPCERPGDDETSEPARTPRNHSKKAPPKAGAVGPEAPAE